MAGGNQQVDGLPLIPDPTGADVYAPKDNVDYRVRTGQAGGLATLDGTGKLLTAQKPDYTKSEVGLGNVDNTSDVNKPVSTAQQTALNLKANLASPALTGTPTTPTAAVGTSTTQVASTAFVNAEIANDAPTKTGGGASGTWGISITGTSTGAPFSGITGKPTTLSGYGITDGMATTWTITAGNGLTGGGTGAANRTLTLGTPSDINGATTNSVTATSHTHAINYGSVLAASPTDLSKHIALYSTAIGFSVTTNRLNYVIGASGGHYFSIGGTDRAAITSTGLSVTGGVTSTGDVTASSNNFVGGSTNVAVGPSSAGNVLLRPNGVGSAVGQLIVNSAGDVGIAGAGSVGGDFTATGNFASNGTIFVGDGKTCFQFSDTFLRLNPSGSFTSGIYGGTGLLRHDGNFQVGTSSSNGFFTSPTTAPQWKGLELGYRRVPLTTTNANYTFVADDAGKCRMHTDATARIYTIPAVFTEGDVLTIVNSATGGLTLTGSGVSLYLAPGLTGAGNRTLGGRSVATVFFITPTQALVYGVGVS